MSKRAIFLLVAGVLCAGAATFVALNSQVGGGGDGSDVKLTTILVATRDIDFGEPLVPGKGDEANVMLTDLWPEHLRLEGAITDLESITDNTMVAAASMVKHQPVLERLIVKKDDLLRPGIYCERITVDRRDLPSWKPGMRVDVYRYVEGHADKFIQCARIYAVGRLPGDTRSGEGEVPPDVYILLPTEFKKTVLETRLQSKTLELAPAEMDCGDAPPVLLLQPRQDVGERVARDIARGEELLDNGQPELALEIFERIVAEHPALKEAAKAKEMLEECKAQLAERTYGEAQAALAEGDPAGCLELCRKIREQYAVVEEVMQNVGKLEAQADEALGQKQLESQYSALCRKLEDSLLSGNIPEAERIVKEDLAANFAGYVPPAPLSAPEDIRDEYEPKIKKAKSEVDGIKRLFEHYMSATDVEENSKKALEKYESLKKQFPAHPYVKKAEEQLRQQGMLD